MSWSHDKIGHIIDNILAQSYALLILLNNHIINDILNLVPEPTHLRVTFEDITQTEWVLILGGLDFHQVGSIIGSLIPFTGSVWEITQKIRNAAKS